MNDILPVELPEPNNFIVCPHCGSSNMSEGYYDWPTVVVRCGDCSGLGSYLTQAPPSFVERLRRWLGH